MLLRASSARLCVLLLGSVFSLASFSMSSADDPAAQNPPQAAQERVFEMRTYITHPGRLEALHKRFREHTNGLFEKHGMDLIGYWTPSDGEAAKNTLVYILAYPSREARDASWKAFLDDPEWKKVYAESHADGPIVMKVESVFLKPTDYSAIR